MEILIKILIGIIALLHAYFLYFEMFAWETVGRKTFGRRREGFYTETKMLAANQGLYNGFLVVGLIWSFFISDRSGVAMSLFSFCHALQLLASMGQ